MSSMSLRRSPSAGTAAGPGGADRRERLGAAAVYAAGAVIFFVLRQVVNVDFLLSPLLYGLILLAGSYFRPRLLASAVILLTWGVAVLLDGKGPLAADRTAQVFMVGFGVSAVFLLLLRRWVDSRVALESLAVILIVAGIWYYFEKEHSVFREPWLWSAVLLASALALAVPVLLRPTGADDAPALPGTPPPGGD
jgi:hypothetical protein